MLLQRCVALCCELPRVTSTLNLLVFMPFSMPSPSSYPNDDDDDFQRNTAFHYCCDTVSNRKILFQQSNAVLR